MGLSGSLICLGLVKTLSAKAQECQFYFACLPNYFHSITRMLKDVSNVFPVGVNSGREAHQYAPFKNISYLSIGLKNIDIQRFDEVFYEQHQVPFSNRWELAETLSGPNAESLYDRLNPKITL